MCKDCFEKLKKEMEGRGCLELEIDGLTIGQTSSLLLIPCTYRAKKQKSNELAKEVFKSRYIAKYCPECGKKLESKS